MNDRMREINIALADFSVVLPYLYYLSIDKKVYSS